MESAGGIGGLLGVFDTNGTSDPNDDASYIYTYDGNGNVSELIDVSDGTVVAHYEYDAFGSELVATGAYADTNPFRFSTKWRDPVTGLLDYGRRWYDPRNGRWTNRDPLTEGGGVNLYGFNRNSSTGSIDPVGLDVRDTSGPIEPKDLPWFDFWNSALRSKVEGWTECDLAETAADLMIRTQEAIGNDDSGALDDLAQRLKVVMDEIKERADRRSHDPDPLSKKWMLDAQRCDLDLNPGGQFNKGQEIIENRDKEAAEAAFDMLAGIAGTLNKPLNYVFLALEIYQAGKVEKAHIYRLLPFGLQVAKRCNSLATKCLGFADDASKVINKHHAIPKFLGGAKDQILAAIPKDVHDELHKLLRERLKAAKFPLPIGGPTGSTDKWIQYFNKRPERQCEAWDIVLEVSTEMDKKYKTNIVEKFWENYP